MIIIFASPIFIGFIHLYMVLTNQFFILTESFCLYYSLAFMYLIFRIFFTIGEVLPLVVPDEPGGTIWTCRDPFG